MGKRSEFEKVPRDYYPTPEDAFRPIVKYLEEGMTFCEPCAGDGRLVSYIEKLVPDSLCLLAMDIEPQADYIIQGDSSVLTNESVDNCDVIITNPPYTWSVLSPMMDRWLALNCVTILLLPADFMHNKRFAKYLKHCNLIVSIGRVKWIEDSKMTGVDNYAWYFFTPEEAGETVFKGRE